MAAVWQAGTPEMEDFFGRIFPKPQNSSRIGFFKGHFFFMKDLSHERPGWLAGWLASLAVLWLALRQGVYRLQKASDIENTCPKQLLFSHETVFRFMKKKNGPENSYPEQILGFLQNLSKKSLILSLSGFRIDPKMVRAGPRRVI